MDSVTDNPAQAPGILEQFGTWLDSLAPVPPWVDWGVALIAVATGIGTIVWILWRLWGANWWASRSRDGAERRALRLAKSIIEAHDLSRNQSAMFNIVVTSVALLLLSSTLFISGLIFGSTRGAPGEFGGPPSQALVQWRDRSMQVLFIFGYLAAFGFFLHARRLRPFRNIDKFTRKSRSRIVALFAKAGVPDSTAAKRLTDLDEAIDALRK